MVKPVLSATDCKVLTALFDAEASPRNGVHVSASSPHTSRLSRSTQLQLKAAENAAIAPLLDPQTSTSESAVAAALISLSSIIDESPEYASAYVNRAQVLRLAIGNNLFSDAAVAARTSLLFRDLNQAVALATPASAQDSISQANADILATAHSHRGYLLLAASKAAGESAGRLENGPAELIGLRSDKLEEMASREFTLGGKYGNKIARDVAVKTNPYAKMCGAIVREAMKKEMESCIGGAVNV